MLGLAVNTPTFAAGMDKNFIGIWLLDESKGEDVKDQTNNQNNGKLQGNGNWVKGKFVNALECDGATTTVMVTTKDVQRPKKQITVTAWINFGDAGVAKDLVIARIEPGFSLQKFNTDVMEGWVNIGGWKGVRDLGGGEVLNPNVWNHVAFTYDGTTLRTYVNGKLDRENKLGGDLEVADAPFTIGSFKGESYFWLGMIDEVSISDIARSENEIKAMMAGFKILLAVAPKGKLTSTWAQVKSGQ
jgi:hypothetical protein